MGVATDDTVRRAFARAKSWRVPPHWSRSDWFDELRAITQFGAACAGLDFDTGRGVPLAAHIYMRAVSAAWTRYRQEWSYYLHCAAKSALGPEPGTAAFDQAGDWEAAQILKQALSQLSVEDHHLIQRLFWDEAGQRRVAATLHISQQSVSRRKARVLRQLRRLLNGQSQLFSRFLTTCWVLLDSLDLLPGIDFL